MHRRKHHKSRKGCLPCKARRIKCDEQGPPCFNCVSRQSECSYANDNATNQPSSSRSHSPSSNRHNASIGSGIAFPRSDSDHSPKDVGEFGAGLATGTGSGAGNVRQYSKFELQLIIQWTTETYKSMGHVKDHNNWQCIVPNQALTCDFLLDGMLAISAMHIADGGKCSSTERKDYLDATCRYFHQFCTSFQRDLPLVTFENHQTFVFGSLMMLLFGLHPPQYNADHDSHLDRMRAVCILLHGTLSLGLKGIDKNRKEPIRLELLLQPYESRDLDEDTAMALQRFREILQRDIINRNMTTPNDSSGNSNKSSPASGPLFGGLTSVPGSTLAPTATVLVPIYEKAMDMLEAWWKRAHVEDVGISFMCLVTTPREMLDSFREGDRIAMLFIFHWSVMLEQLCADKIWWAMSFGRKLLHEIDEILTSSMSISSPSSPSQLLAQEDQELWLEALAWGRARVSTSFASPHSSSYRMDQIMHESVD